MNSDDRSPSRRDLAWVFVLALIVRIAVAAIQTQPGYMDSFYYAVGAQRLAGGFGFTEPYVWNYLDDPAALPHPSHLYWMPLPSILGAASMVIFGPSYRAAQIPFVLLASILPLIAYVIAWRITSNRPRAWLAALLMIFSGFYVSFWGVPESFTPYAVFGSLALLLAGAGRSQRAAFAAGVCAGLAHLTRADGLLLLIPALIGIWMNTDNTDRKIRSVFIRVYRRPILLFLGYFIVMLPWFARNLAVIGAPISPAGMQAAWLCQYDEIFSFGVRLDLNHFLGCGIGRIALSRLGGLGSGVVHLIAENGSIFLAPLMAIGVWRLRRVRLFRPMIAYLVLLYLVMALVFTFAGDRGSLFHSSAALMPFLCAAVPVGLERVVSAAVRRITTWQVERAMRGFGAMIVVVAIALSVVAVVARVVGAGWNQTDAVYRNVGAWLADRGDADSIVMSGNPPGFTYHTGRASIVIPNGDVDTLLAAAQRFGAKWIVLDANRPALLAALYANPELDPRLRLATTFGGTHVLEISQAPRARAPSIRGHAPGDPARERAGGAGGSAGWILRRRR